MPPILGELKPNQYLSAGGNFYHVYYPLCVWEYEYKGTTYQASQIFLRGNGGLLSTTEQERLKQKALRNLPQRSQPSSSPVRLQRKP